MYKNVLENSSGYHINTIELPILGRSVDALPLTTGQVKTLCKAAILGLEEFTKCVIELISVLTTVDVDELTIFDFLCLITSIRANSFTEADRFTIQCEECSEKFTAAVNLYVLSDLFTNVDIESFSKEITTDGITLQLGLPKVRDLLHFDHDKYANYFIQGVVLQKNLIEPFDSLPTEARFTLIDSLPKTAVFTEEFYSYLHHVRDEMKKIQSVLSCTECPWQSQPHITYDTILEYHQHNFANLLEQVLQQEKFLLKHSSEQICSINQILYLDFCTYVNMLVHDLESEQQQPTQ